MEPSAGNLSSLVELLNKASTADAAAEAKLSELNGVGGFRSCLIALAARGKAVPATARLLAAIVLRQSLRSWAAGAPSADKEKEKALLKEQVPGLLFAEESAPMAAQLSLCLVELAAADWPGNWSGLFPGLIKAAQSENPLQVMRSLTALEDVLGLLASKRMISKRADFEKVAGDMAEPFLGIWQSLVGRAIACVQSVLPALAAAKRGGLDAEKAKAVQAKLRETSTILELVQHAVGCSHRLILFGASDPSTNKAAHAFLKAIMTVLRALFPLAAAASEYRDKALSKLMGEHNPRSQLISILLRHLRCLAQWQELRPRGFRTFLAPTITGFLSFILPSGSADTANSFWLLTIGDMRLSGRIFRFIGQCLECSAYDPRYPTDTVAMEPSLVFEKKQCDEIQAQMHDIFKPQVVKDVLYVLVQRFLPLTVHELEEWRSNPENFATHGTSDTRFGQAAKQRAELFLFRALTLKMPNSVLPVMVDMLKSMKIAPVAACPAPDSAEFKMLLTKEAVYHLWTVDPTRFEGPEARAILEGFDIVGWYQNVLSKEVATSDPALGFLRRRVLLLLSCWADFTGHQQLQHAAYAHTLKALADLDVVVALAALQSLTNMLEKITIEDHEQFFRSESGEGDNDEGDEGDEEETKVLRVNKKIVLQLSAEILQGLFTLLPKLKELHHKQRVLETIGLFFQAVGPENMEKLERLFKPLLAQLAAVWGACNKEEDQSVRLTLLETIIKVVEGLRTDWLKFADMITPYLKTFFSNTEAFDFLRPEALTLWTQCLTLAPSLTAEIVSLFEGGWLAIMSKPLVYKPRKEKADPPQDPLLLVEEFSYLAEILDSYLLLGGAGLVEKYGPTIAKVLNPVATSVLRSRQAGYWDRTIAQDHGALMMSLTLFADLFPARSAQLFAPVLLHMFGIAFGLVKPMALTEHDWLDTETGSEAMGDPDQQQRQRREHEAKRRDADEQELKVETGGVNKENNFQDKVRYALLLAQLLAEAPEAFTAAVDTASQGKANDLKFGLCQIWLAPEMRSSSDPLSLSSLNDRRMVARALASCLVTNHKSTLDLTPKVMARIAEAHKDSLLSFETAETPEPVDPRKQTEKDRQAAVAATLEKRRDGVDLRALLLSKLEESGKASGDQRLVACIRQVLTWPSARAPPAAPAAVFSFAMGAGGFHAGQAGLDAARAGVSVVKSLSVQHRQHGHGSDDVLIE